ncbi:peptidylprolyl isomerase [Steroidobacter denitrificans]|nr:peptidylprolyl isomerase [Steroidobacter denitrificans]
MPALEALVVADTAISEAEIAREMQHHPARDPSRARREAARALVVRELLRREIERLHIAQSAQPIGQETGEEAAIRVLLERELEIPEPGEDDCRRYYENNRQRLREPDRIRVRHILLAAAPDDVSARLEARCRGETLIAELTEYPQGFAPSALRWSACPSRTQGGALGWLERGQTTPEFDRQIFMLREGLAGLTVESRYGHHVVWIDEIHHGAPLGFERSRARIAAYLSVQARQHALHRYLAQLQERYGVRGLADS